MRLEWSDLSPAWQTSIAVVLATGGMVSGEAQQGTDALILTKPVSRATYVAAMFDVQAGFLVVTTLGSGVIEFAVSRLLFSRHPRGSVGGDDVRVAGALPHAAAKC